MSESVCALRRPLPSLSPKGDFGHRTNGRGLRCERPVALGLRGDGGGGGKLFPEFAQCCHRSAQEQWRWSQEVVTNTNSGHTRSGQRGVVTTNTSRVHTRSVVTVTRSGHTETRIDHKLKEWSQEVVTQGKSDHHGVVVQDGGCQVTAAAAGCGGRPGGLVGRAQAGDLGALREVRREGQRR